MIVWMWWVEMWAAWLTVAEAAAGVNPPDPPEPPDRRNVVDLAQWRRDHQHGRAA
jgi:hypothetical protein